MPNSKECTTDLLLGAIAGGIAGALTALMLAPKFAPKPSNDLLQSLSHHYDGIMNKTTALIDNITQKSQEIAQGMSSQTEEWAEKALDLTNNVMEELSLWEAAIKEAVITTTVQAEQMDEPEGQEKILDTLEWARKALNVAENATKEINSWAEVIRETAEGARQQSDTPKNEEPSNHIAHEVLEWATLGLNLWQNVKKRR